MTRQFFVIAREQCPRCGGNGKIPDPSIDPSEPECYEPENQLECPECHGNGKIDSEVPLSEALLEIASTELKGLETIEKG